MGERRRRMYMHAKVVRRQKEALEAAMRMVRVNSGDSDSDDNDTRGRGAAPDARARNSVARGRSGSAAVVETGQGGAGEEGVKEVEGFDAAGNPFLTKKVLRGYRVTWQTLIDVCGAPEMPEDLATATRAASKSDGTELPDDIIVMLAGTLDEEEREKLATQYLSYFWVS